MKTLVALSILLLIWTSEGAAADPTVHLATLNWEPYIGEQLEALGFGAEILREAFKRAGYSAVFSFMPWVRALKDVEIGKYDAVCFAYHTQNRERQYLYSAPYLESTLGFGKLRESPITVRTLQNLLPYRIGIVRGFVNTPEFDAFKRLKKDEVKNELTNLKKLLNGRVDLIVIDKFILQHLMTTHFPDQRDAVAFLHPPLAVRPMHLMFSKERPDAEIKMRAFDQAIQEMKNDHTIETIMKRFGYDPTH